MGALLVHLDRCYVISVLSGASDLVPLLNRAQPGFENSDLISKLSFPFLSSELISLSASSSHLEIRIYELPYHGSNGVAHNYVVIMLGTAHNVSN